MKKDKVFKLFIHNLLSKFQCIVRLRPYRISNALYHYILLVGQLKCLFGLSEFPNSLRITWYMHPQLVKLSTSISICQTGYINKKDSFGYGEFNSKMAFSFRITSLGQAGQSSDICLQNTFWPVAP